MTFQARRRLGGLRPDGTPPTTGGAKRLCTGRPHFRLILRHSPVVDLDCNIKRVVMPQSDKMQKSDTRQPGSKAVASCALVASA